MGDAFSYSAGRQEKGHETTSAYGIDWNHPLDDHLSSDVAYYNQGHFQGHHRDGAGVSIWANKELLPQLTVSAGAGPWAYCDTVIPGGGKPAQDAHGIGAMAGAAATWHAKNHMVFQLRANYFTAKDSFSTLSVVGSVGYEFGSGSDKGFDKFAGENPGANSGKDNISVLTGETVVNTPGDVPSQAISVEYRRQLGHSLDLTVSGISEGNNKFAKRSGVAPELWLRKDYLDDRLSLSVDAGVYAGVDQKKEKEEHRSNSFAAGIVSTSASYKLSDHWTARLTWHRPITSYNRDSDVVVAGIGYQF
jgi:hypothetical protein